MVKKKINKQMKKKRSKGLTPSRLRLPVRGKKSGGLTIKTVKLDNKSRKGKYVYLKKPGKRGSYYKLQKGMTLENNLNDYLRAYEGKIRSKKTGVSKDKPAKLYKKILKDKLLIEDLVKKGIWTTHLKNASNMTPQQIKASYKELLRRAVLSNDEETLNLLVQDVNIDKLKHRFEFKIDITDAGGNTLVSLNHVGKKNIEEVISDMNRHFNRYKVTEKSDNKIRNIQNDGYTYNHRGNGLATNFKISILMRKGR